MNTKIYYMIPMRNAESTIVEALKSIRFDAGYDVTAIVVDDGSTDQSSEKVQSLISSEWPLKIKLIKQRQMGVCEARNTALAQIPANVWVFLLDADDVDFPDRQAVMIEYMEENQIHVAGSGVSLFGDETGRWSYPAHDDAIKLAICLGVAPFAQPSLVISPSARSSIQYSEKIREDMGLYRHLKGLGYKFGNHQDSLVWYRRHTGQITKTVAYSSQVTPQYLAVMRKVLKAFINDKVSLNDAMWIARRALRLGELLR